MLFASSPDGRVDHLASAVNISDDHWHQVAVLWDRPRCEVRLYVDNVLSAGQRLTIDCSQTEEPDSTSVIVGSDTNSGIYTQ